MVGLAALGAAPALAADMAVKAPPPPPLPVIFNWTGFYIGANGGGASSHNCWDYVTSRRAGIHRRLPRSFRRRARRANRLPLAKQPVGVRTGSAGRLGRPQQLARQLGVFLPTGFSTRVRTDGIGLFTGQIGWAGWNAALLYFKGGAAVTSNRFAIFDTRPASFWLRQVRAAGAVPSASAWNMPSRRTGRSVPNTTISGWARPTSTSPRITGFTNRINQDVDMFTLRVNYRFGWASPAPVTARY